jgi:hypothetical protein
VSHERDFVTLVLECSVSTSGWKWDSSPSWFSMSRCTIHTLAQVRSQNVFRSKSLWNCSWMTNLRPSFPKTVLMNEVRSSSQVVTCRHTLKSCGGLSAQTIIRNVGKSVDGRASRVSSSEPLF